MSSAEPAGIARQPIGYRFASPLVVLTALVAVSVGTTLAHERPNVLVILADDLGYSDLGCYGSEIETPNLDRLARDGLQFRQFYNTGKCHSSRASLLTGRYPYQAGGTSLWRSVTIAEVLGRAGYFTAMCGKWHLDSEPTDYGFERYFGHLSGASDYFRGNDTYRLNGKPWPVPATGFYSTTAVSDFAMRFLDEARQDAERPWLLYLAYNAPHSPLQALEGDYQKYEHAYDAGWYTVRAARVQKQKELGLLPDRVEASPPPDALPRWEELPDAEQEWERRRMATYAAMVDRLDREIGRVVARLRETGEMDNTLICFLSDNGASPYERTRGRDRNPWDADGPPFHWNTGTAWAWVSNTPFRYYKQQQFEGGIATPCLLHWPAGLTEAGTTTDAAGHLIDLLPTVMAATGATYPREWPGRQLGHVAGSSLTSVLSGARFDRQKPLYFLFDRDRAIRDGDLKLVSFRSNPWQLYDLAVDPTESTDLAAARPAECNRLIALWHKMSKETDDAPPALRTTVCKTARPAVHPEWSVYPTRNAGP